MFWIGLLVGLILGQISLLLILLLCYVGSEKDDTK